MQRTCIQNIAAYENVHSVFLVASAQKSESKNGPFWRLDVQDATGSLEAKIWSPLSQSVQLVAGDFIEIKGNTSLFRDKVQLTIEKIQIVQDVEQLDIREFLPASETEPSLILEEIEKLAGEELHHAPWRNFVSSVLSDKDIRAKLLLAPAAKSVHHAYVGGLLEHSLSVAGLCLRFADHYPEIDRQTLFVAGLFHDIGKIEELSGGLVNDYTTEGRLVGHIIQGLLMLRPYLKKAKVEPNLALHLEHLILSHHGEPEFGAPRTPMSMEAFALHYADNLDSKIAQCKQTFASMAKAQENGEKEAESDDAVIWSPYVNFLGRNLCQMPKTPEKVAKNKAKKGIKEEQGTFF